MSAYKPSLTDSKRQASKLKERNAKYPYQVQVPGVPTKVKIKAIQHAPVPRNKTDLQAFLGLLNLYNIFLPYKATITEPLHQLFDKKATWLWSPRETAAFNAVKNLLSSGSALVQYNEEQPLVLACDASLFGVGVVLSHHFPDGREAPIAYFLRTLSPTEQNYSQLNKEMMAWWQESSTSMNTYTGGILI